MDKFWKTVVVVSLVINVMAVAILIDTYRMVKGNSFVIGLTFNDIQEQIEYFRSMEKMTEAYIGERRQSAADTLQLLERQTVALEAQAATVAGKSCAPYYEPATNEAVGIICEDIDQAIDAGQSSN